jgi:hypothetical protein
MMIHAESKPLAIALNRSVVGTAQGGVNRHVRPHCESDELTIRARVTRVRPH